MAGLDGLSVVTLRCAGEPLLNQLTKEDVYTARKEA